MDIIKSLKIFPMSQLYLEQELIITGVKEPYYYGYHSKDMNKKVQIFLLLSNKFECEDLYSTYSSKIYDFSTLDGRKVV